MTEEDPDPNLREAASSAFALGWNIGEIDVALSGDGGSGGNAGTLPLFNEFTGEDWLGHLVRRVRVRMGKLQAALTDESSVKELTDARSKTKFPEIPSSEQLNALHTTTLSVLMAEDSRLGKAYSLGLALWQLSSSPDGDQTWYQPEQFNRARHYLTDLHTVLPDHAAMGVLGSLLLWKDHAEKAGPQGQATTLPEQGRAWRALLSGEKSATNDLSLSDYVAAGQRAIRIGTGIVRQILDSLFSGKGGTGPGPVFWVSIVAGIIGVIGVVVAAFWGFMGESDAAAGGTAVAGGAVAVVSSAGGLSVAKKFWESLGGVWDKASPALMDAALDLMIAVAITQLPKREDTEELRSRVEELLHPSGLAPAGPVAAGS